MFKRIFKKSFRRVTFILAAALVAIATTLPVPAFATNGRTTVGMCIDSTASGAHCAWSVNDKGEIDVCNKRGCVYCPSATAECTAAKGRKRPIRTLSVGSTVKTSVGSVEVTQKPFTGNFVGGACLGDLYKCGNRCQKPDTPCDLPE
jgi:hypothetical protein